MKKVLFLQCIAILIGFLACTSHGVADTDVSENEEWQAKNIPDNQELRVLGTEENLPPVVPGERVRTSGKTLKIWSTVGPVPVNPAPVAPSASSFVSPGDQGLNVIVDARGDRKDKRPK